MPIASVGTDINNRIKEPTMQPVFAGGVNARPEFNAFGYIERLNCNILTSASFTPPPNKTFWQRLIEFLSRRLQP